MNRNHQAKQAEDVPDGHCHWVGSGPGPFGSWRRIRQRHTQNGEQRCVVLVIAVVIGDRVNVLSDAHGPCRAQEHTEVSHAPLQVGRADFDQDTENHDRDEAESECQTPRR